MAAFRRLRELKLPWVRDLIPAYASLTIVYDAFYIYEHFDHEVSGWANLHLRELLQDLDVTDIMAARHIEVPVCYDPSLGFDIEALAAQKSMSVDELINLHSGRSYTVYMLGFLPGFPYMGSVDAQLVAPRLSKPRALVPAGCVGIAGEQTGIYPLASPGGWNIIGQTPLRLFDAAREPASYCQPGDQVTFVPISAGEFFQMKQPS